MTRGSRPAKIEQWSERFERFERSGLTVVQFCRQEGVSQPSFYQWRKKLTRPARRGQQAVTKGRPMPRAGHGRKAPRRQPNAIVEMPFGPSFRPVSVTTGSARAACLTVRLPSGVELAMTDHLPVVETVVGKLLEHAADMRSIAEDTATAANGEVWAC